MSYVPSKIGYKVSNEDILSFNPTITDKRANVCINSSKYFYTIMVNSNEAIFRDELGYILKLLRCYNCSKTILSSCITKRYCSYRCYIDAYKARRKKRREELRLKRCLYCNKEFRAKRRDAKYCSNSHRVLASIKHI